MKKKILIAIANTDFVGDTSSSCERSAGVELWQTNLGEVVTIPSHIPVTMVGAENEISEIYVFPNPVNDELTISFTNTDALASAELFDIVGNRLAICGKRNEKMEFKIDFKPYATCIYLLKIKQNNLINSYKIIH